MTLALLKKAWPLLAVVALSAASFVAGRLSAPILPARVETVERVEYRDRVQMVEVKVRDEARERIVYRTTETRPDGTVLAQETEREAVDVHEGARVALQTEHVHTAKTSTVTVALPLWRLGAGVESPLALRVPDVALRVERRIAGPFFVAGSIAASPVDPLRTLRLGVGLSVEF